MKMKKRLLGIFLSLVLVFSLMPGMSLTVHAGTAWTDCYPEEGEYVLVCKKYPDKVLTITNYRFQLSDYTGDAGQKWTLIRPDKNKPSYVIAFGGDQALDVPCWDDDMEYGDYMSTLSWSNYGEFSEYETNVFRFSQIEGGPTGDKFAIRVVSEAANKYDYVLGWDSEYGQIQVQQYDNTQLSQYWSFVPAASYFDSEHEHTIEYVQEGNSIIATCSNETGLCLLKDRKAVVEIVPTSNTTKEDSSSGDDRKAHLVISGDERSKNKVFTDENITKGEIRYYKATLDGTTYTKSGEPLDSVPEAVGEYVAEVDVTVNNVKYTLSTVYSISNRIIVGKDDTTSDYCPTSTSYKYSLSQQIYGKDEVGAAGSIKGIDFYNSGNENTRKFEIYMIETDKESFGNNSDWVSISSDNKVFEGNVTFKTNEWNTITFDTPFKYSGDKNLLLCVRDITGDYKSSSQFKAGEAGNKVIYAKNDNQSYDISNPGKGYVSNDRNMIRMNIIKSTPAYGAYLVDSSDTADTLQGKVVHFNGKDWYLIKDDSQAADAGKVTLLAADTSFGRSGFDDGTNVYSNSNVKRTLDEYTDNGEFKDVAEAIINTPNGRLYLLSSEEARNLPAEVLKADFTGGDADSGEWWLRTAVESGGHVAYVKGTDGSLGDAVPAYSYGIRPALTLDLSKVTFNSATNTFSVGEPVIEYPFWIGDTQVTSENASDVFGDGKVSFTPATTGDNPTPATLTLNGYSNNGAVKGSQSNTGAIYYDDFEKCNNPLTIKLADGTTNTLTTTGDRVFGIYATGTPLTITGNGTLNIQSADIGINDAWGVTISGGTVNVSSQSEGISAGNQGLTVSGGTVNATGSTGVLTDNVTIGAGVTSFTATGTESAIKSYENVTMNNAIPGTGWTDTEGTQGKADIEISAEGQELSSSYKKVQFPVVKEQATVTIAPTAKTLTYNGQAQELVTAGEAEGGTMQYALGTDATKAPADNLYTTSIPAGTDAGTYYVWYKVVGDSNHTDVAPVCVEVTISKRSVTVSSGNQTITYGQTKTISQNASDYEVTGLAGGDSATAELSLDNNTNQINIAVTIKRGGTDVTANYDIQRTLGSLTVNPKELTVKADAASKTEGEADPSFAYKVEGLVKDDKQADVLVGTLTRDAGEAAGTYVIRQGTLKLTEKYAGCYTIKYTGAELTIKAKTTTAPTSVPTATPTVQPTTTLAVQPSSSATPAPEQQTKINTLNINAGFEVSQKGSRIYIKWGKVEGAESYDIYVAYCGTKFSKEPTSSTAGTKVVVTKLGRKKINLKKNFKVYVVARNKKEKLAKTITGHIVGRKNKKFTNAKSIKLTKDTISLGSGKTEQIKAKTILVNSKKKQLSDAHATEFRYATSDSTIATVSKKGVVKGVGKGTCIVYVYSRNGYAKEVKVTVN